jgi:hypothetical protein
VNFWKKLYFIVYNISVFFSTIVVCQESSLIVGQYLFGSEGYQNHGQHYRKIPMVVIEVIGFGLWCSVALDFEKGYLWYSIFG